MIKNKDFYVIAGPCSIDYKNVEDIYKIAEIKISDKNGKEKKAIFGTRVVGLKSRTIYNEKGKGMGIDFEIYKNNLRKLINNNFNFDIYPSVRLAKEIIKKTNLTVATEVMDPYLQLKVWEKYLPKEKVMIWNPAVNQLGWPVKIMGEFAKKNKWFLGLKNPKWLGDENDDQTSMEKNWLGLVHYSQMLNEENINRVFLIHRGVDISGKKDYRNLPVHEAARRIKISTGTKLLFDPSHIHGPKLKNIIVEETIKAAKMMIDNENYLYDGILIEVGQSKTDTEQHISIEELKYLVDKISQIRNLIEPK
ncbi:MAG: hypothetical protein Fur009_1340 [Candidatus Microgenomates bacterium]